MTEVLLTLLVLAGQGAGARIVPRPGGALLEITSDSAIHPEISVVGREIRISLGMPVPAAPFGGSMWIEEVRAEDDGLLVTTSPAAGSASWALSTDSLTLLLLVRAAQPFQLPSPVWAGPPPEPVTEAVASADSAALDALVSGLPAPWLEEFDTVVLDPGHGGRDPGAVGASGTFEKDRTLEIALLARDLISVRMPGVRVVMTREDDRYVSLAERTRIANREKADLFISIHCNASTRREAGGFETFFLSLARTDDARAVAAMENMASELDEPDDPGASTDPLSFLLADIAQNLYLDQSSSLAALIQASMASRWPSGSDRGVKQAGFYVLRGAWMPSILVEVAFISNPSEERLLESLDFRFRAASAIVAGIEAFMSNGGSDR